ncbi:DMT family transporter [Lacticaseibacillus jixiensis]|uniref:DMT family transporter n=1 Tax=Lacticaseibacillus jixiensis TaxID=3231926 RepID=UPI0036F408B7
MNKQRAFALMVAVVAAWGASYMWMKVALAAVSPLMLVGLRFGIAFIVTWAVFPHALAHLDRQQWLAGLLLGSLLFALFASVMFGLQTTAATTAGFLVSTTAMFVMLFTAISTHRLPSVTAMTATGLVLLGLFLLVTNGKLMISGGAALCLLTAALYALHILASGQITKHLPDTFAVSVLQLGVAGGEGLIASWCFETPTLPQTIDQWGAIIALGVVCSAFGFVAQVHCQQRLSPTTISMIFSLEPLFAAGFGMWLLRDQLSGLQWLGALVIFLGVFGHEWLTARLAS